MKLPVDWINSTGFFSKALSVSAGPQASESRMVKEVHLPTITVFTAGRGRVVLRHRYDQHLYKQLKSFSYLNYSSAESSWIADTSHVALPELLQHLKQLAQVRLHASIELSKAEKIQEAFRGNNKDHLLCPQGHLEVLFARGYIRNTIRAYHSLLLRFIQKLRPADKAALKASSAMEINRYHAQWIASGEAVAATVNQTVNALRF